ncbi:S-adenosylmethionine:tRNA ribosyltransferase-isomerase [Povalibacter uvarum]|uniref:S-adenosylmethionine:tRNA ribosyltransferase-isomerase n=1 Tax=Povalibacter uvarum TaxID=732238 RepID=A0A841HKA8_9GAMM|nr:S-adenosylmethionine:tRNA ribosyltransferase-isomerase [Povalibacter uvarum]MBB6092668.1 S-adenosylmethionine:tRNA ribosyltransferase-isomerase [Povalibacter uvarum]
MLAATAPIQRPLGAKLLHVDELGRMRVLPRAGLIDLLEAGDLVVANDAATMPASLQGVHAPTRSPIELRLAGRRSLASEDLHRFIAVAFGAGDYRTRTEHRAAPPHFDVGDVLELGPLTAHVEAVLDHPRLLAIRFGSPAALWAGLAAHGRPIQYAHVSQPLELWDVWTPIAGMPVAYEPPSAGFVLDWQLLAAMRHRGIEFTTITHAAGISSTGDASLDARLPFDEPYEISFTAATAINRALTRKRRIIAVGTTVVRALEHAIGGRESIRPGLAMADQRIATATRLRVVDTILSGTHEPRTSHHELLHAFAGPDTLTRMDEALNREDFRTHEFGDSVLLAKRAG